MTIFVRSSIMDRKISSDQVKRYASGFNSAILESFFSDKQRITGQDILNLTPVRQVNLFIIHHLMVRWTEELSKHRSPYFDQDHEEVKAAFTAYSNALSKHISISRKDFEPLLEKATSNTLLLVLSPYDFYAEALDTGGQGKVSTQTLHQLVRYLKINQIPLERLVARVKQSGSHETITGREAFALLDLILEETPFTPDDPEIHLNDFSKVRPVSLNDLMEAPKVIKKAEPVITKSAATKKADLSGAVQTSLYDELSGAERPTLADNFQKQKIHRLKEQMTINQKFMFTKALFNGDFDLFGQALERLDMMDQLSQALKYLDFNYPEWDKESEEYLDFLAHLERRYL